MKYVSIIAVLLAMCLIFVGCKDNEQTDKPAEQTPIDAPAEPVETEPQEITFSNNSAIITLPATFTDYTEKPIAEGYAFLYGDAMVGLRGTEDQKTDLDESVTSLESYAAYQASVFGGEAVQQDNLWTLSYEDLSENEPQMLVCVFYETENAFWTVQSYCPSNVFEIHQADMWNYVKSVTFE